MTVTNSGTLVVDKVSRSFGGVVAANALDFAIAKGEFLAVVGPNGAGKSTLLQMISGIVRPQQGEIRLGERRIDRLRPEQINALGISRTFQTSRVFPMLTIRDSIMVGAQVGLIGGGRAPRRYGPAGELVSALLRLPGYRARVADAESRAEEVMKMFGDRLWPRRDDQAFSLSYANRRRLEIARALVQDPDILLLDEPAAGMNPTETAELAEVLAELRSRRPGMTIVMVEHKLQVVRQLAERCIVMAQGAVIVDDTPAGALEHPRVIEAYLGTRRSAAAFGKVNADG
ncbi:MAG: ABC transporter ATP-binding protein [Aquamicrobium sp.]|uniref:ABC transporter ATP-binding protein n=1 Tax=Aquamicrobium sp. TaxID=1872579 RepID=UPI00349ED12D|nr:ABC transporter ATP-binding protein [Aquamicrobium sp.]